MQRAQMTIRIRESASLHRLEESTLSDAFLALRGKLKRLEAAGAILGILDRHLEEGDADPELFDRVLRAFERLSRDDEALEVDAFRLFFVERAGHAPVLDRCVESSTLAPKTGPLISILAAVALSQGFMGGTLSVESARQAIYARGTLRERSSIGRSRRRGTGAD